MEPGSLLSWGVQILKESPYVVNSVGAVNGLEVHQSATLAAQGLEVESPPVVHALPKRNAGLESATSPNRASMDAPSPLSDLDHQHMPVNSSLPRQGSRSAGAVLSRLIMQGLDPVPNTQKSKPSGSKIEFSINVADQEQVMNQSVCDSNKNQTKALLDCGANSNTKDATGTSALYPAVSRGDKSIVSILLEHGADPNGCDADGANIIKSSLKLHPTSTLGMLRVRHH